MWQPSEWALREVKRFSDYLDSVYGRPADNENVEQVKPDVILLYGTLPDKTMEETAEIARRIVTDGSD